MRSPEIFRCYAPQLNFPCISTNIERLCRIFKYPNIYFQILKVVDKNLCFAQQVATIPILPPPAENRAVKSRRFETDFFEIVPNPANDFAYIFIEKEVEVGGILEIRDAVGRLFLTNSIENLIQNENKIDLKNMPEGIWTVVVKLGIGQIQAKQLVILKK